MVAHSPFEVNDEFIRIWKVATTELYAPTRCKGETHATVAAMRQNRMSEWSKMLKSRGEFDGKGCTFAFLHDSQLYALNENSSNRVG